MTPLWITAALFVAVIAAKIYREFTAPHDAEDIYDR